MMLRLANPKDAKRIVVGLCVIVACLFLVILYQRHRIGQMTEQKQAEIDALCQMCIQKAYAEFVDYQDTGDEMAYGCGAAYMNVLDYVFPQSSYRTNSSFGSIHSAYFRISNYRPERSLDWLIQGLEILKDDPDNTYGYICIGLFNSGMYD